MASASIFDLDTTAKELQRSIGSKFQTIQVPASKNVQGRAFSGGDIDFSFELPADTWFMPSRSYFRVKCKLLKNVDGTLLTVADNIAPSMSMCSNLFSGQQFLMGPNQQEISTSDNHTALLEAYEYRKSHNKEWLDTIGASSNFWQASFDERLNAVCSDGVLNKTTQTESLVSGASLVDNASVGLDFVTPHQIAITAGVVTITQNAGAALPNVSQIFPVGSVVSFGATIAPIGKRFLVSASDATTFTLEAVIDVDTVPADVVATDITLVNITRHDSQQSESRRVGTFDLLYRPLSLSINKVQHALPAGKYTYRFNPKSEDQLARSVVESIGAKTPADPSNPVATPNDYYFEVSDMVYYACTIQGPRIEDNVEYYIDLDNTAVNIQGASTNNGNTQLNYDVPSSTKALALTVSDARANGNDTRYSQSLFKFGEKGDNDELKLRSFYLAYAQQQFPQPRGEIEFSQGVDLRQSRYMETLLNSGSYYESPESLEDWTDRGQYFWWPVLKEKTDRSTRAIVNVDFNNVTTSSNNMRIVLLAEYRRYARIKLNRGMVVDAQVFDG